MKIASKSKNFYLILKRKVVRSGKAKNQLFLNNESTSVEIKTPNKNKTHQKEFTSDKRTSINLQSFREVSSSKARLNVKIIQCTNRLLCEVEIDTWNYFFTDPREAARHSFDAGSNTERVGCGDISMSPYDIAWVAMIPVPLYKKTKHSKDFRLAFPECLAWLLSSQDESGSWARTGAVSIAPVLSGLWSLGMFESRAGLYFEERLREIGFTLEHFNTIFEKGIFFMRHTLNEWNIDDIDMKGFEIVTPFLISQLEKLNPPIFFDFPDKERYLKENKRKINLIPIEAIFKLASARQPLAIIHSLEALIGVIDLSRVQNPRFQAINGSYGSPAATAAVLIDAPKWDDKAYEFLRKIISRRSKHVSTLCETRWVIHCVSEMVLNIIREPRTDLDHPLLEEMSANLRCLVEYMKELLIQKKDIMRWVGWNNRIPADVDNTAVLNYLVTKFDPSYSIDIKVILETYWNGKCFLRFPRECTFSVSSNVHVVTLLLSAREKVKNQSTTEENIEEWTNIDNIICSTINFILSKQNENQVWIDEWNVSPWYTTMKSIQLLLSLQNYLDILQSTEIQTKQSLFDHCRKSINYALSVQHSDGSWGEPSADTIGNMEETSLVVRLLRVAAENWPNDIQIKGAIEKGRTYLLKHFDEAMTDTNYFYNKQPFLWFDKQLYTVPRILKASILAALWDNLNSQ
ncbi:12679_t:CDS:2 [Ambispora gerdemannii]|uniref:12679_t:CDS:1 n=1 Tax=Ambispora gerdemannii TaxID=144530 RepID=A0A9N8ZVJ3_9GLOM|nr:12679_t:CDS:2 [Ambispora gerdemannii]